MTPHRTEERSSHRVTTALQVCRFHSYGAILYGLLDDRGEIRPMPAVRSVEDALARLVAADGVVDEAIAPLRHSEMIAAVDAAPAWLCEEAVELSQLSSAPVTLGEELPLPGPSEVLPVVPRPLLAVWPGRRGEVLGAALAFALAVPTKRLATAGPNGAWACSAAVTAIDLADAALRISCSIDRDGVELWSDSASVVLPRTIPRGLGDGLVGVIDCGLVCPPGLRLRHHDIVTVSGGPLGVHANRVGDERGSA